MKTSGNLNVVRKLILPHSKKAEETTSKPDKSAKKMEPGNCLDPMCGSGEHSCDGRSCVRKGKERSTDSVWVLHEQYCKYSIGVGVLLKDVQLAITGDAGVRAPLSDSVKRGVMAWGVANNPETYQRVELVLRRKCGFP